MHNTETELMSKIRIIARKIAKRILIFFILILILYGLGRFIHIFPPIKAIIQLVKETNIENKFGEKSLEYTMALDKLSDIYYEKSYKKWGTKNRQKALKKFIENDLQNTIQYANCLYKYSEYLRQEEDEKYQNTAKHCRESYLRIYKTNDLKDDSKRNLVEIIISTFDYEIVLKEKIRLLKLALEINYSILIENHDDTQKRILLFNYLGSYSTDEFSLWIEAQNSFEEALKLSKSSKYRLENTLTKIQYARLLTKMQNFNEAKNQLESCDIEVIHKGPGKNIWLILYRKQLMDILLGLGLSDEASKQMNALEMLNYKKDPSIQFLIFYRKAQNKIIQGNMIMSYYYLQRIKWLTQKSEVDDNQHLLSYYYLELLYNLRYKGSEADMWKAKIKEKKITDDSNYIGFLFAESQIERLSKDKTYFDKTSELFVTVRKDIIAHFKYMTENQRMTYWQQYQSTISMLYEAGSFSKESSNMAEICYDAALFSKGILLGSSVEFAKLLIDSGDTSLLFKYYQLLELRQHIDDKNVDKQKFDSLSLLANKLERDLVDRTHDFGDYTNKMLIKWQDVQSKMKFNDIAVEFIDFKTGKDSTIYSALILRKNWSQPKMVKLFEEKQLVKLIRKSATEIYSPKFGVQICNLIWGKLLPFLNKNENVFFASTNILHKLAIESLPLNDSVRINDFFHAIRVSSTKQLYFHLESKHITSVVLYGGLKYNLAESDLIQESKKYPNKLRGGKFNSESKNEWGELPKTKEEIDSIEHLLSNKNILSIVYSGNDGNEESFKNLSGKINNVIHIATHGFFYSADKAKTISYFNLENDQYKMDNSLLRSGLILSGANRAWVGKSLPGEIEDGILTAQEVSMLNLQGTELVVLSACETGLGEITSEGVFGLQRAFKKAGAKTIVMSLWKVDDKATSEMMQLFYSKWLSGMDKREAFRLSQQELKRKYNEPYYWAGFVMLD